MEGLLTMTKGKFGLSLSATAVIAFVFCALRQPQSVLLVAGFALLVEKDAWLNRQVIQALLLTITYYLAELVFSWIFGALAAFFGWARLYGASGAMSSAGSFVSAVLQIALIVFSVLAVLRVLRGKDAKLPWLSKLAGGDFAEAIDSMKRPKADPAQAAPPVQAAPVEPSPAVSVQAPPPAPPVPSAPPASSAPVTHTTVVQDAPASAARICPSCSAPLQEDSRFCTECGAKVI